MDDVIDLINYNGRSYDEQGNEILQISKRRVFCRTRSVYHTEYYEAAQLDLSPTVAFIISHQVDYQGEKEVEWRGKTYDVIRVDWDDGSDEVTLQCELKVSNGEDDNGTTRCPVLQVP